MKKISTLWLGIATLLACACSENGNEFHQTYFYPQTPSGLLLYADQETDSVALISYDSWTASPSAEWFAITPTSLTVPPGYSSRQRIDITTTPNTTGQLRRGVIQVDSYAKLGMAVSQTSWLNITSPSARYDNGTDGESPVSASFAMTVKADTTAASVSFQVFKDGATLSSSDAWITVPGDIYTAGSHKVTLTVEPNRTTEKRRATLTLTSNGVSTPVEVTQNGRSK